MYVMQLGRVFLFNNPVACTIHYTYMYIQVLSGIFLIKAETDCTMHGIRDEDFQNLATTINCSQSKLVNVPRI